MGVMVTRLHHCNLSPCGMRSRNTSQVTC